MPAAERANLQGRLVVSHDHIRPERTIVHRLPSYAGGKDIAVREESFVTSDQGGVSNFVIRLRDNPSNVHERYRGAESDEVVLAIHPWRFSPRVWACRTSQTIVLVNSSPVSQSFRIPPDANPLVLAEEIAKHTFKESRQDPIPVSSDMFAWMRAYVVVTTHPYVAISDRDGRFIIRDLPVGEFHFVFWHQSGATIQIGDSSVVTLKMLLKPGMNDLGVLTVAP